MRSPTRVLPPLINAWPMKCSLRRFCVPAELHSDQGQNFEASVFSEVCWWLGNKKTQTTPMHPQSDRLVLHFNRTLETDIDTDQPLAARLGPTSAPGPVGVLDCSTGVYEVHPCSPHVRMRTANPGGLGVRLPLEPEVDSELGLDYFHNLRSRLWEVHELARWGLIEAVGGTRVSQVGTERGWGPPEVSS